MTTEQLDAAYAQMRLVRLIGGLPPGAALLTIGLLLAGLVLRLTALAAVAAAEGTDRAAAAAGSHLPWIYFALAVVAVCGGLVVVLRAAALGASLLVDSADAAAATVAVSTWTPGGPQ